MAGFLEQLLGLGQGDPLKDAAKNNWDMLGSYDTRANTVVNNGVAEGRSYLDQLAGLYKPLAGATSTYADAIGLNGADGSARAGESFTTSPGYDFQLNQGLQALDRRRAAAGSFQSGGADIDTMTYATGLADQSYNSWLDRLMGASNTALTGQGNAITGNVNLTNDATNKRLGIVEDLASGYMAANNQTAAGDQQNAQGMAGLGSNLFKLGGRALGFGGF